MGVGDWIIASADAERVPEGTKAAFGIRLRDKDGWYRVIYVSKFEEGVYVLHAFQKKTNQTPEADVDHAERAYKAVVRQRAKR